jgi:hypothetical protein
LDYAPLANRKEPSAVGEALAKRKGFPYLRFGRIDIGRLLRMLKVDIDGLGATINELKKFEPELFKQMKKEIVDEPGVATVLTEIKSNVPPVSPLRGMIHNGRTRYLIPKVRIFQRPRATLGRGGRERSLISFEAVSPRNAVGFEILDLVGGGPNANSENAKGMLSKLKGKASRYVWKGYEKRKDGVSKAVLAIIERYSNKANVRLKAN